MARAQQRLAAEAREGLRRTHPPLSPPASTTARVRLVRAVA